MTEVSPRDVDATLAFHIPHHPGHRILGRDGDQHMRMVGLKVPFQNPALFLPGQIMQHATKVFPELAMESLPPAFRYPHDMELAVPFGVA